MGQVWGLGSGGGGGEWIKPNIPAGEHGPDGGVWSGGQSGGTRGWGFGMGTLGSYLVSHLPYLLSHPPIWYVIPLSGIPSISFLPHMEKNSQKKS